MLAPQDFLQTTLRILRRLGECRQATLYVPLPVTPVTRPILLHDGEGPAAPELVEAEAASSFHRAHLEDGVAGSPWSGSDPVTWLPSADPEVVLVRVPALESLGGSTVNGPERRRLGTSGGDSGVAWLGLRSPELRSRLGSYGRPPPPGTKSPRCSSSIRTTSARSTSASDGRRETR